MLEFSLKHSEQALFTHVTDGFSVHGVRDFHVVGRLRVGNCAGAAARLEEVSSNLLTGTNFGKTAVDVLGEVDFKGFVFGG